MEDDETNDDYSIGLLWYQSVNCVDFSVNGTGVASPPLFGEDGFMYFSVDSSVRAIRPMQYDFDHHGWEGNWTYFDPDDRPFNNLPGVFNNQGKHRGAVLVFGSQISGLTALRRDDGTLVWNVLPQVVPMTGLAMDDNNYILYYANADTVVAVRVSNGATLWANTVAGASFLSAPTMGPRWRVGSNGKFDAEFGYNIVILTSGDGLVFAFDGATGYQMWQFDTGAPIYSSATNFDQRGESFFRRGDMGWGGNKGSAFYVANSAGVVFALHFDGSQKWARPMGQSLFSQLSISGKALFGGFSSLFSLSLDTGDVNWDINLDDKWGKKKRKFHGDVRIVASPFIRYEDGLLYVLTNHGYLHAVMADSGEAAWNYNVHAHADCALSVDPTNCQQSQIPVVTHNNVVVLLVNTKKTPRYRADKSKDVPDGCFLSGWGDPYPTSQPSSQPTLAFGGVDVDAVAAEFGGDSQHTGRTDFGLSNDEFGNGALSKVAPQLSSEIFWNYPTGNWISQPVIDAEGNLYFASNFSFISVDPSGTLRWEVNVGSYFGRVGSIIPFEGSTTVLAADQSTRAPDASPECVIVGNYEAQKVFAFSRANGSLIWESDSVCLQWGDSMVMGPGQDIYIVCGNIVAAMHSRNGVIKWAYNLEKDNNFGNDEKWTFASAPAVGTKYTSPSWSLSNGTILYLTTHSGVLVAVNPEALLRPLLRDDYYYNVSDLNSLGGRVEWTFSAFDSIDGNPVIGDDGTIYFGAQDQNFYAVDRDGSLQWFFPAGDAITHGAALARDGTIYFGAADGYLYALHRNGSLFWMFPLFSNKNSNPNFFYATEYGNDNVYSNADPRLKNYDGRPRLEAPPVVDKDGIIYCVAGTGYLYAVRPDGSEKWSQFVGLGLGVGPVMGGHGAIYFASQHPSRMVSLGNPVPTSQPTNSPTSQPTNHPSSQPSSLPTNYPSSQPSSLPTSEPTNQPSAYPSGEPSTQPTSHPSLQPSFMPSSAPSEDVNQPSSRPTGVTVVDFDITQTISGTELVVSDFETYKPSNRYVCAYTSSLAQMAIPIGADPARVTFTITAVAPGGSVGEVSISTHVHGVDIELPQSAFETSTQMTLLVADYPREGCGSLLKQNAAACGAPHLSDGSCEAVSAGVSFSFAVVQTFSGITAADFMADANFSLPYNGFDPTQNCQAHIFLQFLGEALSPLPSSDFHLMNVADGDGGGLVVAWNVTTQHVQGFQTSAEASSAFSFKLLQLQEDGMLTAMVQTVGENWMIEDNSTGQFGGTNGRCFAGWSTLTSDKVESGADVSFRLNQILCSPSNCISETPEASFSLATVGNTSSPAPCLTPALFLGDPRSEAAFLAACEVVLAPLTTGHFNVTSVTSVPNPDSALAGLCVGVSYFVHAIAVQGFYNTRAASDFFSNVAIAASLDGHFSAELQRAGASLGSPAMAQVSSAALSAGQTFRLAVLQAFCGPISYKTFGSYGMENPNVATLQQAFVTIFNPIANAQITILSVYSKSGGGGIYVSYLLTLQHIDAPTRIDAIAKATALLRSSLVGCSCGATASTWVGQCNFTRTLATIATANKLPLMAAMVSSGVKVLDLAPTMAPTPLGVSMTLDVTQSFSGGSITPAAFTISPPNNCLLAVRNALGVVLGLNASICVSFSSVDASGGGGVAFAYEVSATNLRNQDSSASAASYYLDLITTATGNGQLIQAVYAAAATLRCSVLDASSGVVADQGLSSEVVTPFPTSAPTLAPGTTVITIAVGTLLDGMSVDQFNTAAEASFLQTIANGQSCFDSNSLEVTGVISAFSSRRLDSADVYHVSRMLGARVGINVTWEGEIIAPPGVDVASLVASATQNISAAVSSGQMLTDLILLNPTAFANVTITQTFATVKVHVITRPSPSIVHKRPLNYSHLPLQLGLGIGIGGCLLCAVAGYLISRWRQRKTGGAYLERKIHPIRVVQVEDLLGAPDQQELVHTGLGSHLDL